MTRPGGRKKVRGEDRARRGSRRYIKPRSFGHLLRWLTGALVIPALVLAGVGYYYARSQQSDLITLALQPTSLWLLAIGGMVLLALWVLLIVLVFRRHRPAYPTRVQRVVGPMIAASLCLLVALPLGRASWYALVQRDLLNSVLTNERSITAPTIDNATKDNPWGDKRRVNLLLLGGDGGVGRSGIRTDTVILASMDTRTGQTVLFSLPRNLQRVPFPEGSVLADYYPNGFVGSGDIGESMLNAIYRNVPAEHPDALQGSDNEGADALKMGVSTALGLPVDYYLLVNLDGFQQIVDAMGGITVNVNERVAINGQSDLGIPPTDWIEPGPNQHLDGFHALWFTRGRYGSTDYKRMERQRCALNAIVDEANPLNLLTRYTQLASAAKRILRTDIPQDLLPAFAQTALKTKNTELRSVVFQRSANFDPNDPDYDTMRAAVQRAIHPKPPKPITVRSVDAAITIGSGEVDVETPDATDSTDATDASSDCTYQPTTAVSTSSG